ncbi:MAG: hypothetical protein FD126_416, partial [Elusimicrobia bacterium]
GLPGELCRGLARLKRENAPRPAGAAA